jgi:hypothetical protein
MKYIVGHLVIPKLHSYHWTLYVLHLIKYIVGHPVIPKLQSYYWTLYVLHLMKYIVGHPASATFSYKDLKLMRLSLSRWKEIKPQFPKIDFRYLNLAISLSLFVHHYICIIYLSFSLPLSFHVLFFPFLPFRYLFL